jgi:hypothetical protein
MKSNDITITSFSRLLCKLRFTYVIFFILSISILNSCSKGKNIPDVSHIEMDLDFIRFEKEMYGIDSTSINFKAAELAEKHPDFVEIYAGPNVMRERTWKDSSAHSVLSHLMKGPQMKMLYDTCMVKFDDFSTYEEQLEEAFKYYHHYFPEQPIPKIYTCITEFGYQGFTYGPEILVIGTEHYMGKNFPAYNGIFPRYQSRSFTPEHLVSSSMELMVGELVGDQPINNMLDAIIKEGKKLYILDRLLPYTVDSLKLKYSAAQTEWCNNNEFEMWTFFVNEDLIYSTDMRKYMKYTSPTPTSPGMPQESPGRTANWIGWQIIKKYMKMNPDETMQDLINETDSQQILKKAKYKPKL